jgi:hypothetical protein
MKIYISHGAGPIDWFVVEPQDDPDAQVASLRDVGRTVIELDVEPWQGLDEETKQILMR